jgi:AcrR family transcriptional regulator
MRDAIVEAAITVIAEYGVAAPTSLTASTAGVAQGSIFKYFETKADLLNAAYLRLKAEIDTATLGGLPDTADTDRQLHHMWNCWMRWGVTHPQRRLALSRLASSDQITKETRERAQEFAAGGIEIFQRASAHGVFADAPFEFLAGILDALAGLTMDFMIADPLRAETYCETAFKVLRRALS